MTIDRDTAKPKVDLVDAFKGKSVVITGHTGFKGSWLSLWLHMLGARVTGISNGIPTDPSHYELTRLSEILNDERVDIREAKRLGDLIRSVEPDYLFHLAAQPLVLESYREPLETFSTNVMGTANVLDALRGLKKTCTAVLITSDKCYDNLEWTWGYREIDRLGGKDPYSASKGAAELVINGFVQSFFNRPGSLAKIAVARAGNVIGGGDWAPDRLVPDCVLAWSKGETVTIRSPLATRPWQHVLEPLSGYLTLAARLMHDRRFHGEPYNFGPPSGNDHTVASLISKMSEIWPQVKWNEATSQGGGMQEAGLLKLNCDKALHQLGWMPVLDFDETISMTTSWYRRFYEEDDLDARLASMEQIEEYRSKARQRQDAWHEKRVSS